MTTVTIIAAMLIIGAAYVFAPRWVRKDILFGITINPEFRDTEQGRQILRRYSLGVTLLVIGWTALAALESITGAPAWVLFILLGLEYACCVAAYAFTNRAVRPFRVPQSAWRVAELQRPSTSLLDHPLMPLAGVVCLLIGFVFAFLWPGANGAMPLLSGAAALKARWDAVSSGIYDNPFSFGVGVWVGAMFASCFYRFAAARRSSSRTPDQRTLITRFGTLVVCLAGLYVSGLMISATLGYPPPSHSGAYLQIVLVAVLLLHLALLSCRSAGTEVAVGPDGLPLSDRSPDQCWKWGLFYSNAEDPALLVPSRSGPGYTLNFARPVSWLAAAVVLAAMLIVIVSH